MTVLAVACVKCHTDAGVECVKCLLQRGARVDVVDHLGQTALHTASWFGARAEAVQLLIQHGSAINLEIVPETIMGGFLMNASRLGVGLGVDSLLLRHLSEARGGTALHVAGFGGNK